MSARLSHALVAVPVLALALVAGCKKPARDPSQWPMATSELERAAAPSDPGAAAYRRTCVACHGSDGKGNGGRTGADFTSPTGVLTQPDEQLLTTIRDGKTGSIGVMPAHRALLTDEEQRAVLAYVRRTYGAGITVVVPVVDAGVDAAP